jgi:hypothetical protein
MGLAASSAIVAEQAAARIARALIEVTSWMQATASQGDAVVDMDIVGSRPGSRNTTDVTRDCRMRLTIDLRQLHV